MNLAHSQRNLSARPLVASRASGLPMEVGLVRDAAETLRTLLPRLQQKPAGDWRKTVEANVRTWWATLEDRVKMKQRTVARVYQLLAKEAAYVPNPHYIDDFRSARELEKSNRKELFPTENGCFMPESKTSRQIYDESIKIRRQVDDGRPRRSQDDIQREQLGPRGVPGSQILQKWSRNA